ncbi:MAG: abortive infection system antitoxin AbiGi family protein [Bacteroidota bacterium]
MNNEKATNLSSNVLYHFTNSIDNIINILENNFIPRYCPELVIDFPTEYSDALPLILPQQIYPMVSFCDIPLALIRGHLKHYGNYGIGLTKEWGIRNYISPVLYYHYKSVLRFTSYQIELLTDFVRKDMKDLQSHSISGIRLFMKPYRTYECRKLSPKDLKDAEDLKELFIVDGNGKIIRRYENKDENELSNNHSIWRLKKILFYDEREWRYIGALPNKSEKDSFATYQDYISNYEKLPKPDTLKFIPDDIKFLIVNKECEIRLLRNAITQLRPYKNSESDKDKMINLPILSSESICENISI